VEDAYIHFDNVLGTNLDVLVGQFQTCDPLMKRELRLTYEDYRIYGVRVGNSFNNLTYDRGVVLSYDIEKTGTNIIGMIVNGNGKTEAANDKLDRDQYKNLGIRLSQSIVGKIKIGGFYYRGKEAIVYEAGQSLNEITYYGPDLRLQTGPFEFTGQYLIREDTNPLFYNLAPKAKTTGIVAELVFSPKLDRSRWYLTALYNNITSDFDDLELNIEDFGLEPLAYQSATLSGTYLLARNLKLIGEYTRDLEHDANRFVLGLVTAY
jgi:hypothetical protein